MIRYMKHGFLNPTRARVGRPTYFFIYMNSFTHHRFSSFPFPFLHSPIPPPWATFNNIAIPAPAGKEFCPRHTFLTVLSSFILSGALHSFYRRTIRVLQCIYLSHSLLWVQSENENFRSTHAPGPIRVACACFSTLYIVCLFNSVTFEKVILSEALVTSIYGILFSSLESLHPKFIWVTSFFLNRF